MVTTGLH